MTHSLRVAIGSDPGPSRAENEDSALVSPRLLAVADGMGGHVYGEVASAAVIDALAALDTWATTVDLRERDTLALVRDGVAEAARRLDVMTETDPELRGMGTTVTALLWDGTGFAVAHVGDSRAYVLRDGRLRQLTHDHTMVQSLVDAGRITAEEAERHPRRSVLMRTLQAGNTFEPDLFRVEAQLGDRVLVCSDGLTDVVGDSAVRDALASAGGPDDAVHWLITLAVRAGGPDNITCVVADVVSDGTARADSGQLTVGAHRAFHSSSR
ncbi:PP2C family protein-serine/threonine phosphatase [Allokutzneria albata]|uniref:Serine/threonine protein phosphatase PrpC n=1 Tax=Allokutzneria albata TaxID=211114 RepID=A0A1G9VTU7_ALLAB|nr:protein phosphatase 2C domain-containing protein [Allokutzneria albata]SDM75391.1 Serine/threonine protein phosphatase PrpC [Allokutzneria albata]